MATHAYTPAAAHDEARAIPRSGPLSTPLRALALAAACAAGIGIVWVLANLVASLRYRDAWLLHQMTLLQGQPRDHVIAAFVHSVDLRYLVFVGAVIVAVAVARRRPWHAAGAGLIMILAPLSAELLKPLLWHLHDGVEGTYIVPGSFPSGHSTGALSVVLAALLVSPPRARRWVALIGGVYLLIVSAGLLILQWHMPSDVIAGYLLATMWAALALAALRVLERRGLEPSD